VVGFTTYSLVTNFVKIGQGVFDLQGSENWGFPLTWLVALTTVQHYRADCERRTRRLAQAESEAQEKIIKDTHWKARHMNFVTLRHNTPRHVISRRKIKTKLWAASPPRPFAVARDTTPPSVPSWCIDSLRSHTLYVTNDAWQ